MTCPPAGGSNTGILPVDSWENMGGTPMLPSCTFLPSLFAHALSQPAATQDSPPRPPDRPQSGATAARPRRPPLGAVLFDLDSFPHTPIIDP